MATRFILPLVNCGDPDCIAQIDMCILHNPTALALLVMVRERNITRDPEAEIVAAAIACFEYNNRRRELYGLSRLHKMTIPGIVMWHTCPIFYLIPVTEELSGAVVCGEYPANETQVTKCITVVRPGCVNQRVMNDTRHRKMTLQRFLAFKMLAKCYWDQMLGDGQKDN